MALSETPVRPIARQTTGQSGRGKTGTETELSELEPKVDEEIPPFYVKRFEYLEKCYINVTNYYLFIMYI